MHFRIKLCRGCMVDPYATRRYISRLVQPMLQQELCYKVSNGEYGCNWCLHPGERVEKGKGFCRVFPPDIAYESRSLRDFDDFAATSQPQKGIVYLSPLLKLAHFNIVDGFAVDAMHAVGLGVIRTLTFMWLNNKDSPYYIGNKVKQIDERLLNLKVLAETVRTQRSITTIKHWKASEWFVWMWVCVVVLDTVLPEKFLAHFRLLAGSVYKLCAETLAEDRVREAAHDINLFVQKFASLYGRSCVSYNVHILTHMVQTAQRFGALWQTWCFSFENMNGEMVSFVKSSQGIMSQIAKRYSRNFFMRYKEGVFDDEKNRKLFRSFVFRRTVNDETKILNAKTTNDVPQVVSNSVKSPNGKWTFAKRAIVNSCILQCGESKKRCNNFVLLNENIVGEIKMLYSASSQVSLEHCPPPAWALLSMRMMKRFRELSFVFVPEDDFPSVEELHELDKISRLKLMCLRLQSSVYFIKPPMYFDCD